MSRGPTKEERSRSNDITVLDGVEVHREVEVGGLAVQVGAHITRERVVARGAGQIVGAVVVTAVQVVVPKAAPKGVPAFAADEIVVAFLAVKSVVARPAKEEV